MEVGITSAFTDRGFNVLVPGMTCLANGWLSRNNLDRKVVSEFICGSFGVVVYEHVGQACTWHHISLPRQRARYSQMCSQYCIDNINRRWRDLSFVLTASHQ